MIGPPGLVQVLRRLERQARHDQHNPDVRLVVQARARDACEYCLMPTNSLFHVDHVIPTGFVESAHLDPLVPRPEGVPEFDHLDNFAWSCPFCNVFKGRQLTARVGRQRIPLFHPRRQIWAEHFVLAEQHLLILGTSPTGVATARALRFNDSRPRGPLTTRYRAITSAFYPPAWARPWAVG